MSRPSTIDTIKPLLKMHALAIAQWLLPEGKIEGNEWVALNHVRADRSLGSLKVNTVSGLWSDFALENVGGDLIDLYMYCTGCDTRQAIKDLSERYLGNAPRASVREQNEIWTPITPVPPDAPLPEFTHKGRRASAVYEFRNVRGELMGYTCRIDKPGGKKDVLPVTFCQDSKTGRRMWRWKVWQDPTPVFGAEKLTAQRPAILIVEGEKTAKAAAEILPFNCVLTWVGGTNKVLRADWSILKGRSVFLWPDADEEGAKAMQQLAIHLKGICDEIRIVHPPEGKKKGWDLADAKNEGWTREATNEWIQNNQTTFHQTQKLVIVENETKKKGSDDDGTRKLSEPFRCLGYSDGRHWFFMHRYEQIIGLTPEKITKQTMLMLAPADFWERRFRAEKRGVDWTLATDYVMRGSCAAGHFVADCVRGRGVWLDNGRVVIHTGGDVMIGNVQWAFADLQSEYIYQRSRARTQIAKVPALRADTGAQILELLTLLPWQNKSDAYLLAGWVFLAPLCGVLRWRPHIWLSGGAGSGKSTVLRNIVCALLRGISLDVQGSSTESGIRQALKSDALPVTFDESEANDTRAQDRIAGVLDLARIASTDSGAEVVKGTSGGVSLRFSAKTMFCLSSIVVATTLHADKTRWSVLQLRKDRTTEGRERYEIFESARRELVTPAIVSAFQVRAFDAAETIQATVETFVAAVLADSSDARLSEQLGTLIAGAWALTHDGTPSFQEALAFVRSQRWSVDPDVTGSSDELQCLTHLLASRLRIDDGSRFVERTIGELIAVVCGHNDPTLDLSLEHADSALKRAGIKVCARDNVFIVANTGPALRDVFSGTPWAADWKHALRRIEGAEATDVTRFTPLTAQRGTQIPLTAP